jgi:phosphatidate cytidylyltransferase
MSEDTTTGNGPEDDNDSEVLSLGMTDRDDPDQPDIEDEPQLAPADPDSGFDGWLGGEEDPYQGLSDEGDAAGEVADWLAFSRGEPDGTPEATSGEAAEPPSEPVSSPEEPEPAYGEGSWTGEGDPPAGYTIKGNTDSMLYHRPDSWMYDETDAEVWFESESVAIGAGFLASPTHPDEADESDEADEEEEADEEAPEDAADDEQEVEAVPAEGDTEGEPPSPPSADLPPKGEETDDTSEFDIPTFEEDTGEVPIVAEDEAPSPAAAGLPPTGGETEDTGELPVVTIDEEETEPGDLDAVVKMSAIKLEGETAEPIDEDDAEPPPSLDDYTAEDYLGAATQDHADLAAAIAAAEGEETEKVALSAVIPGLESGVVGFDDVVEGAGAEEEPVQEPGSSNLVLRVGTGLGLVAALALSLLWRPALIVFVLAVFVIAAGEFYSALIHRRFKPMSLFGFLGIVGAALGTAAWGVGAIPIAMALMATVLLLFNAVSPRRDQPAANFSLTVLVAAWIGGLGAFAFDIIAADDYQVLVISLVALVALVDIAAYFVGGRIGRRSLAPVISPKKTIEGLVAGTLAALAAGAVIGYLVEPIDLPTGLLLGAVVAVFAPIGDLAVSVVKRSLEIKDMGSILPGHGGLLDRIDALMTVIPAVWVVLTWLALI